MIGLHRRLRPHRPITRDPFSTSKKNKENRVQLFTPLSNRPESSLPDNTLLQRSPLRNNTIDHDRPRSKISRAKPKRLFLEQNNIPQDELASFLNAAFRNKSAQDFQLGLLSAVKSSQGPAELASALEDQLRFLQVSALYSECSAVYCRFAKIAQKLGHYDQCRILLLAALMFNLGFGELDEEQELHLYDKLGYCCYQLRQGQLSKHFHERFTSGQVEASHSHARNYAATFIKGNAERTHTKQALDVDFLYTLNIDIFGIPKEPQVTYKILKRVCERKECAGAVELERWLKEGMAERERPRARSTNDRAIRIRLL